MQPAQSANGLLGLPYKSALANEDFYFTLHSLVKEYFFWRGVLRFL